MKKGNSRPPSELLLSRHPRHARRTYDAEKRYESRRVRVRAAVGPRPSIYETNGIGSVTGVATPTGVRNGGIELSHLEVGFHERIVLQSYSTGARYITALEVDDVRNLKRVRPLGLRGVSRPPQSYRFIRR